MAFYITNQFLKHEEGKTQRMAKIPQQRIPVYTQEGEWATSELSGYQTMKNLKFCVNFTFRVLGTH